MKFVLWIWEIAKSPGFAVAVNIASLYGLYLAVRSVKDSRDTLKRIDNTAGLVTTMSRTLSTRFEAEWPDYLPRIAQVLASAKHDILILSLQPGIGIFSAVADWLAIANAINNRKLAGVKVTLICGDEPFRIENHRRQFHRALEDWSAWLKLQPSHAATNQQLLEKMPSFFGAIQQIPTNGEQLIDSLNSVQNSVLCETYAGTATYLSTEYLPLFAWIADNQRAVFGISNSTGVAPAFYTEDSKIVDSLTQLANRYRPG
jgi:hypothetical protein